MSPTLKLTATVHSPGPAPGDPAPYAGPDSFTFVLLKAQDADGVTGYGATGRFLASEVAGLLNGAIAAALPGAGDDPLPALAARFNPRGMTGVVVSALSALDIALTDIRAKRASCTVATLLGGRRASAPVHVTCGFPALETDNLVRACAREVEQGARGVKVLVAARGRSVAEDIARLRAVRAAIGATPELIADANCGMDLETAAAFLQQAADLNLAWLEEPVHDNDRHGLAALSAMNLAPIGAGQMEQCADRFALLTEAGVRVIQPNAVFAGGFGAATDVAQAAARGGLTICPAGGWDLVNLHWMCGVMGHGAVELHRAQARIARLLVPDAPGPSNGLLTLPDRPGIGIEPDAGALARCRIL